MQCRVDHPRDEITRVMQRIFGYRMTTTSSGNLSIRDDHGDIRTSPARVDKKIRREPISSRFERRPAPTFIRAAFPSCDLCVTAFYSGLRSLSFCRLSCVQYLLEQAQYKIFSQSALRMRESWFRSICIARSRAIGGRILLMRFMMAAIVWFWRTRELW